MMGTKDCEGKTAAKRPQKLNWSQRELGRELAAYLAILLVVSSFALIRFRLRNMPLERDEGEYAYAGQLILQGIAPYKLAYNMKLPGTYASYALILAIFGESAAGIHIGLLLVNAATSVMIYFLGKRLSGRLAGVIAAATYALLSTSPAVLGLAGHATHFVVEAAVAGALVLLRALDGGARPLLFASGSLFGLAFLMKQPGIFFVGFAICLLARSWRTRRAPLKDITIEFSLFSLGACLPLAIACMFLWRSGVFHEFLFWTFDYAREYGSEQTVSQGIANFLETAPRVVGPSFPLWVLGLLGITSLLWSRKAAQQSAFLVGFLLCSLLAVTPGFYFREHYFILLLPAVSLLSGVGVACVTDSLREAHLSRFLFLAPVAVFALFFSYSVYRQRSVLFFLDPVAACRAIYGANPFPEAVRIGEYLRGQMPAEAKLAVLGSEPEIYFYSNRHSATGYIYTYSLMESQKFAFAMQRQMIHEVEGSRPEFVVFVDVPSSWLAEDGSPQQVAFNFWAANYIAQEYLLVGAIDLSGDQTEYFWGESARGHKPQSPYTIRIFKRLKGPA
jgi:hypothetical protein